MLISMIYETHTLHLPLSDKNFSIKNHVVTSKALKKNALGDSPIKHNFVLQPSHQKSPLPLVVHLSGYFGNGPDSFNQKTLEDNFPKTIIELTNAKKIPPALHVFVDAMTGVGGSQFINSEACGNFSDYIQDELIPSLHKEFSLKKDPQFQCVIGSSSGGYGALHHISLKDSAFGVAIAIAPDSFFTASLLPDFYKLAPYMEEYSDIKKIQKALADGSLKKKKNFFHIMNALAMTLCYAPLTKGQLTFPIDSKTGELDNKKWQNFLHLDPVHFLPERKKSLKDKHIYLDVGIYDDFHLFFGARQMQNFLQTERIKHVYTEFPGTHYGLTERKQKALQWLKEIW